MNNSILFSISYSSFSHTKFFWENHILEVVKISPRSSENPSLEVVKMPPKCSENANRPCFI